MNAPRLKRQLTDQCSTHGHEDCPLTWNWQRPKDAPTHTCTCECHVPRATCNRCGMSGLAWARAPQFGFRRQRLLVPTLFQPFVNRVEVVGVCIQTGARHVCGSDEEAARYAYLEAWLTEQYDEEQERRREMGRAS